MTDATERPRTHFTTEERDALRKVASHVKKFYGLPNERLAEQAAIKAYLLKNFFAPKRGDPSDEHLWKLASYLFRTYLTNTDFPADVRAAVAKLADQFKTAGAPPWMVDVRSIFPAVSEELTHDVAPMFSGLYTIYRNAAVGGDIVVAKLVVDGHEPSLATFENTYYDSLRRLRKTNGYVINTGHSLHLIGHVIPFPVLKLIVFDLPETPEWNRLHGLTISCDFRHRHFASRCVAIKYSEDRPTDNKGAQNRHSADPAIHSKIFRDDETGVFKNKEKLIGRFRNEYDKIKEYLTNKTEFDQVLFLKPPNLPSHSKEI